MFLDYHASERKGEVATCVFGAPPHVCPSVAAGHLVPHGVLYAKALL